MAFLHVNNLRKEKTYKLRRETAKDDFKKLYRFDEENVGCIAEHFLGTSHETRGGALKSIQRMKIFLRSVSDPGFQVGVAQDLGCDQSTISKTVNDVS